MMYAICHLINFMKMYKNKEFLIDEYINKKKPIWKTAKEQSVAYGTIYYWMDKYNIKRRNYSECVIGNHIELTKESLEFIEGELLGDGSLQGYKNISARYTHGSKYKKYLEWLSRKLRDFGLEQSGKIQKMKTTSNGKEYISYKYISKFYRELSSLRKKWYPNGKKIVPKDLKLTPIIVRQWYIGDGCLVKSKKSNPWIQLSTDAFEWNDIDILVNKLFEIGIGSNHRVSNNRICINTHSTGDFIEYIGNCPKEIENIYG